MDLFGLTIPGYSWQTVLGSAISGVFLGALYALVALGLTLIYGVLHIINFAHGAMLMLAMYGVYFLWSGLGVNAFRVKLKAICLSGAIGAAGGVYYVQKFLFIDPGIAYGPGKSIEALVAPIIGGLGTVAGPLVGAVFLHGAGEGAKGLIAVAGEPRPGLDLILYGVILVLALGFLPRGRVGLWSDLWRHAGRR